MILPLPVSACGMYAPIRLKAAFGTLVRAFGSLACRATLPPQVTGSENRAGSLTASRKHANRNRSERPFLVAWREHNEF